MPYAAENSTANSHIHNSRGERGRSFHTTSKKMSNQKKTVAQIRKMLKKHGKLSPRVKIQ